MIKAKNNHFKKKLPNQFENPVMWFFVVTLQVGSALFSRITILFSSHKHRTTPIRSVIYKKFGFQM